MKLLSFENIELREKQRPGWKAMVAAAIVRTESEGVWYDDDHPSWRLAWRQTPPMDPNVQKAIARQTAGCTGCGDPGA